MNAQNIIDDLIKFSDPEKADFLSRFFKTKPGQYGEGDILLGITVPKQRSLIKKYLNIELDELSVVLQSEYHECRLTALLILVAKFNKANQNDKRKIYDFYMSHIYRVNNWDLVDLSATYIVGPVLGDSYMPALGKLAVSKNLWERRIAMVSCFWYIKNGNPVPAFDIADILKYDEHDLIQKVVGWMLREVGKRCDKQILIDWLLFEGQYKKLPRTELRYAIERFPEAERKAFLRGEI